MIFFSYSNGEALDFCSVCISPPWCWIVETTKRFHRFSLEFHITAFDRRQIPQISCDERAAYERHSSSAPKRPCGFTRFQTRWPPTYFGIFFRVSPFVGKISFLNAPTAFVIIIGQVMSGVRHRPPNGARRTVHCSYTTRLVFYSKHVHTHTQWWLGGCPPGFFANIYIL